MFDKLDQMKARYEELEKLVAAGDVARDPAAYARAAKEMGSLARTVKPYLALLETRRQIAAAEEMAKGEGDPSMRALAQEEIAALKESEKGQVSALEDLVLASDPNDDRDVLLEIRAGTGGEEAALFAADLARMYQRYADARGWKAEVVDATPSELKGFREAVLSIKGDGVYRTLKFESGGHRVQRVPETETQGRIHTSAATVAVLPEVEEVEFVIRPEDLRIDTYRAGGKGGQHVNKTESAVRILHIPTGVMVAIQDERSQHKNRAKAMRILRAKLFEAAEQKKKKEADALRKGLIGSGDRGDRIRTYNFPQNRVTDHRVGVTVYQLDRVIEGEMDPLLVPVAEYDRRLKLGLPVEKGKDEE